MSVFSSTDRSTYLFYPSGRSTERQFLLRMTVIVQFHLRYFTKNICFYPRYLIKTNISESEVVISLAGSVQFFNYSIMKSIACLFYFDTYILCKFIVHSEKSHFCFNGLHFHDTVIKNFVISFFFLYFILLCK